MKKLSLFLLIVSILIISFVYNAKAEQLPVNEIVKKSNKVMYYEGKDGRSKASMKIVDSQGRERKRKFVILRYDIKDGGEQKYYVYFKAPSDVRDMVYMVWKHLGKDDDRWLYLPALDLVRRVAASDKRSSFVGSDFVYEDVSGRNIDLDKHVLVEAKEDYYKIKNIPKDSSNVKFKYYHIWIDKDNFIPQKAEYYDKEGDLYRRMEVLKVENIQGHPTVTKMKASNLEAGSHTILEFLDVKYDIGLTEDIFTERYLRRPPVRWIR